MSYFSIHNHTYMSNYRLRDSVNKPEDVIITAIKKGIKGVAITDHETIAAGPQLMDFVTKGKDDGTIPEDFVFAMGNEAYLIDDSKRELVEAQEKVRYNHFILIAKNQRGWDFLKKQTSKAWENNIYSRGMERVPTYKSELKQMMQDYKGDVIASTACIGGELPQLILQMHKAEKENDKNLVAKIKGDIHSFISYLIEVFGKDNVYFELQPSRGEEQLIVNEWLPKIGAAYDIKCIVSTDAHYLTLEQQEFHKQYLQASEGEREVESFYATTYIFSEEELLEYFEPDLLNVLMTNTLDIRDKIEQINYRHLTVIPRSHIPDFENDYIQMMKKLEELIYEK